MKNKINKRRELSRFGFASVNWKLARYVNQESERDRELTMANTLHPLRSNLVNFLPRDRRKLSPLPESSSLYRRPRILFNAIFSHLLVLFKYYFRTWRALFSRNSTRPFGAFFLLRRSLILLKIFFNCFLPLSSVNFIDSIK